VSVAHHYDSSTTHAAVRAAIRAELDALGDRLNACRDAASAELERLAAFRWVTEMAGLRSTEVADRAGVSRQTLANVRADRRGADYEWPPDTRIVLELGLRGPQSTNGLVDAIGQPPVDGFQVTEALERVVGEGLVAEAGLASSGSGEPVGYWRLTAAGIEDLPRRLRDAAMPESRAWTAYVQSDAAEAGAIAEAGVRALGEHGVAVIPAGAVHGMERPEVAFWVEASDPQLAQAAAVSLFADLRARAGLGARQEPVLVAALIPPKRAGRRA
jgi:hypothetical protein